MLFEKGHRLRQPENVPPRLRVVFVLARRVVVVMRSEDRRISERVVVEPMLPTDPSSQPAAVADLVRVSNDGLAAITVDPFGDVENRVGRSF